LIPWSNVCHELLNISFSFLDNRGKIKTKDN